MNTAVVPTRLTRLFDDDGLWPNLFTGIRAVEPQIKVEEKMEGDTLIVRAEAPGIDPEKDVDISLVGDVLTISVQRRAEEKSEKDGYSRTEFRYGSFSRSVRVPDATNATDVKAAYADGILEIKVPIAHQDTSVTKVPVTRA
jgi:HSP20 family protein